MQDTMKVYHFITFPNIIFYYIYTYSKNLFIFLIYVRDDINAQDHINSFISYFAKKRINVFRMKLNFLLIQEDIMDQVYKISIS